ncbi:hypothetical protein ACFX14_002589 [Malus domestica]
MTDVIPSSSPLGPTHPSAPPSLTLNFLEGPSQQVKSIYLSNLRANKDPAVPSTCTPLPLNESVLVPQVAPLPHPRRTVTKPPSNPKINGPDATGSLRYPQLNLK